MKPIAPPKPEKLKIRVPRNPLESEIETKVCRYAKARGWLTYKFSSPAHRSVPDRLLISPGGQIVFIEFKRLRERLTPNQASEVEILCKHGQKVHVVNSIDFGKSLIDKYTLECTN